MIYVACIASELAAARAAALAVRSGAVTARSSAPFEYEGWIEYHVRATAELIGPNSSVMPEVIKLIRHRADVLFGQYSADDLKRLRKRRLRLIK